MEPETRVESRRIYAGRVLNLRVDRVRLGDGREAEREVAEHPGAAVVIPLSAGNELLMVRQFRYAVGATLLELPAGTLEAGESPAACAARELLEEVGAQAAHWEPLASLLPSPGVMTEVMHLFLATGLMEGVRQPAGDEDLRVERVSLRDAVEMVLRGEIRDAKSVAGILLVARRRGL